MFNKHLNHVYYQTRFVGTQQEKRGRYRVYFELTKDGDNNEMRQ